MRSNKKIIICLVLLLLFLIGIFISWRQYKVLLVSSALHNIGNLAMQEYFEGNESAIYQAEQYYSGSLTMQEHSDTRYNYNFVNDILSQKNVQEENKQPEEESESQDKNEDSGDEKEQLKQLTERIKAQQSYNQKYYNKSEQQSNFQSAFESFFGEINRGGEKDW